MYNRAASSLLSQCPILHISECKIKCIEAKDQLQVVGWSRLSNMYLCSFCVCVCERDRERERESHEFQDELGAGAPCKYGFSIFALSQSSQST